MRDAIEVETVRYRQALRKLLVALPGEVPEIVLEPQLANEQTTACRARTGLGGLYGSHGRCMSPRWASASTNAGVAPSSVRATRL